MPNWCEGTIKFRGSAEAIIDVMTHGLASCYDDDKARVWWNTKYSTESDLYFEPHDGHEFWLVDTYRMFVDMTDGYYASKYNEEEDDFIIALPFRAAWGIRAESTDERPGLDGFAKTFNVDIRATGFEQGLGFEQTVEVNRTGEVILNEDNDYGRDYGRFVWECAMPHMGG